MQRLTLAITVAALVGAGVLAHLHRPTTTHTLSLASGTALAVREKVADFDLVDAEGLPFTRGDLTGGWTLLFTGFTHCPDVCPTTLALLARLQMRLHEAGQPIRIVFLSVDPARDTPEALARYLGYFGADVLGATGDEAEITALGASLGLAHVRVPGGDEHYTVDHSTALVLIDPEARMAGYFRPPLDPDALEQDLLAL